MENDLITYQEAHEMFYYHKSLGELFWKQSITNKPVGRRAGYQDKNGRRTIGFNGKKYHASRLIWLYCYGYFPENQIDHINRNPSDNRIENLREVSPQCNVRNTRTPKNNKSGVKGVSFVKNRSVWLASICVNMRQINIGKYKDFSEAVCARLAAEQCLGWASCDSNSPAFKYVKKMQKNAMG